MTRRVLLLEIGAGDLPAATPTPQTASSWFPTPYVAPPPLAPGGFALASIVGGVRASWNAVAGANVTYELQRAPDASGAPGTAQSVYVGTVLVYNSNESTKTWWRVRTVVRGVPSGWTAWAAATPQAVATPADVSNAQDAADAAQHAADAANAALADIASDGILSPVEKPTVIRDNNVILTEQAGIDAQATAYGITTEKTAYDGKVSALTSYLASLTTPVLWSNLTGNTTIVGTTFRSKFADVYTTRQTLLNAIYAAAKAKADAAQSTGNTALANAASAQSAANAAQTDATSSLATLADIASDSKLTANEKVKAKQEYLEVTGEQAGIDGQATAFGITTEKTAYDNAITALKNYLRTTVGVLDASYNWAGITGTTAITRSTWDSTWTSVYTSRQALLNKIAAVAKALADGAQGSADAITAASAVINGSFAKDTSGWTFGGDGTFYREDGGNSANPAITTYLVHQGAAGGTTAYALNAAKVPVSPGQVVSCIGAFKSVGANVAAYAQMWIRWSDASGTLIGTTIATVTCGPGGTYLQCNSEAKGAAPAGAAYAQAYPVWKNHTSGYITCNSVRINAHLANVDDLPDGATYGRPLAARLSSGKPLIDFAEGIHNNKNIDYIGDGSVYGRVATPYLNAARPVINFADSFHSNKTADYIAESAARKWAAESGATVGATWGGNLVGQPLSTDNQIAKSNFEDGQIGAWAGAGTSLSGAVPAGIGGTPFTRFLRVTANQIAAESFAVTPGDVYSLTCMAWASATGTLSGSFLLRFVRADGSTSVYDGPTISGGTDWGRIGKLVTVPADAVRASPAVTITTDGTTGAYAAFMDFQCRRALDSVPDGATYGRTAQTDLYVSGGVNRVGLRIAGSGHLIGDQRNLVSSITRNLGITRSATALTANAGGAVDINAHTIQMGGASVSYSAKSNAVTGLTTSASYYIYTRDNYAGGSPTWLAGTNQNTVNSFDDAYNAGVVTIPTSGSSGGGSGGGGISGCVAADMYLRRGLTARHLAERWRWWRPCILRGQDGWHFVRRRPRIQPQPCCTITMADGSTLTCSLSTPITVRTGESILAPMVYGHDLFTDSGWQRVIDVELLPGERDVVRISTGGHSFLAGMHPHLRISTHNTIKA